MYSAGFITLAFSVVRVHAINLTHLTRLRWLEAQAPFALWSMVEAFAAILCVNVPALVGAIAKWRKAKQLKNESLQLREYKCYADEASKKSRKSSRNMSTKNTVCEWPIDTIKVMMVCGSVQALIDLILIILPWFVMWNLKINMRMKGALHVLYSLSAQITTRRL